MIQRDWMNNIMILLVGNNIPTLIPLWHTMLGLGSMLGNVVARS